MRYLISALFLGVAVWFLTLPAAEARDRDEPYVPEIIEIEQPNGWCYVLVNPQKLIGSIHILSCFPKGKPDRNPNLLSLEVPKSD